MDVTVIVDDDPASVAIDESVMAIPGVREEVIRYEPVVAKLTDISLLAIYVAANRETRRRAAKLRRPPPAPPTIGNRPPWTRLDGR